MISGWCWYGEFTGEKQRELIPFVPKHHESQSNHSHFHISERNTNKQISPFPQKNAWYVQQLHYFHSPFASYPGMYPKELRTTLNRLQDIRKKQIQVVRTKDPVIADYLATTLAVTVHCTRLFSMMYFNRLICKDSLDWPALICLGKDVGHERAKAFNGSFWNKTR